MPKLGNGAILASKPSGTRLTPRAKVNADRTDRTANMTDDRGPPALAGVHRTAIGAAVVRASHLLRDGEPKILRDEFALPLSGLSTDLWPGGGVDIRKALALTPSFIADEAEVFAYVCRFIEPTERFVAWYWPEISRVARALISYGTLTGADLARIANRR